MSTSKSETPLPGQPTPDELAGIPVCKEEDQIGGGRGVRVRGGGGTRLRGGPPAPQGRPTADELAGIPVTSEGDEDLTVRPRTPPKQQ